MTPSEYLAQDAVGLADLVRRRHVSALEVLEAALEREAATNPRVNAVTLSMEAQIGRAHV